ncbi:MAG: hypothetical protein IV100_13065 [Myxococcales bacterium]|nr:hypothetical protein [Myxococcales bacterium]
MNATSGSATLAGESGRVAEPTPAPLSGTKPTLHVPPTLNVPLATAAPETVIAVAHPLPPSPAVLSVGDGVAAVLERSRRPATVLRTIDRYAVLSLPVRELDATRVPLLTYLAHAAEAGRPIAWDQSSARVRALVAAVEALITATDVPPDARAAALEWLSAVRLSNGPYDARAGDKLVVPEAMTALRAPLTARDPELARFLFEPDVLPRRSAGSSLDKGGDVFSSLGGNLYVGVTAEALLGFEERFPRNSRLVARDGRLVEEVYRTGRLAAADVRPSPRGLYAEELGAVSQGLRAARVVAPPALSAYLDATIAAFETGDAASLAAADDAWLAQAPPVAASFGFVETDWDPRARKGRFQALVVVDDTVLRTRFEKTLEALPSLISALPWTATMAPEDRASLPWPVQAVAGTGATGPILPAEITLPNDAEERGIAARTWLLGNVVRAVDAAMDELTLRTFASAEDLALVPRYREALSDAWVVLDWLVARLPVPRGPELAGRDPAVVLKELTTPLDFLKRTLVILHLLAQPAARSVFPELDDDALRALYRRVVRHETILLGRTASLRIEDDHHKALRTLVAFLADRGALRVDLPAAGDTTTPIQYRVDVAATRDGIAELLKEVARILAAGDYTAATTLFEHAVLPDAEAMAPLRERVRALGTHDAYAFDMVLSPF